MNIPVHTTLPSHFQRINLSDAPAKKIPSQRDTGEKRSDLELLGSSLFHMQLKKVQQSIHKISNETPLTQQKPLHDAPKILTPTLLHSKQTQEILSSLPLQKSFPLTTFAMLSLRQIQNKLQEGLRYLMQAKALQTYSENN